MKHPDLQAIARRAMRERGFLVDLPESAREQAEHVSEPVFEDQRMKDLSSWLWSSIDNDSSRDLDQIEFAREEAKGIRIFIGIADVDALVALNSPLDEAAERNTVSVYTGVVTFPMLPERLSTNLTSLNEHEKRLAIVTEMLVTEDGRVQESSIYHAIVENKAQLTYNGVAEWLEQGTPGLSKIASSPELQQQLQLQDRAASNLRKARHKAGALTFETAELNPLVGPDGSVIDLETRRHNRASLLIEDLMIAANQVMAEFLESHEFPSFRRIVRTPHRWDRIVSLAASLGYDLPPDPDSESLQGFLNEQRRDQPEHFPDISLAVVKLIGRGEYDVKFGVREVSGHFSLAVNAYSHSTAPNRRYPDLITQRLVKALLGKSAPPYSDTELQGLARHCTEREDAATKVERFVKKCAAAVYLQKRIGQVFEGIVSGINQDGTWVRVSHPVVEGRLFGDTRRLDVGSRVRVELASTDAERGFIDFELA